MLDFPFIESVSSHYASDHPAEDCKAVLTERLVLFFLQIVHHIGVFRRHVHLLRALPPGFQSSGLRARWPIDAQIILVSFVIMASESGKCRPKLAVSHIEGERARRSVIGTNPISAARFCVLTLKQSYVSRNEAQSSIHTISVPSLFTVFIRNLSVCVEYLVNLCC